MLSGNVLNVIGLSVTLVPAALVDSSRFELWFRCVGGGN
jgi:hypothetical protein